VRVPRRFSASSERVFDAWLDPEKVPKWMSLSGEMVRVQIDARVGGTFSFVERRDGEEIEHIGEYLEMACPRRLVFTWCIPQYSPDSCQCAACTEVSSSSRPRVSGRSHSTSTSATQGSAVVSGMTRPHPRYPAA